MNKAFWELDIKSFDDERRTFKGIASTPSVDRMGDIVEPQGVRYKKLPLPMMWQHGRSDIEHPVGLITAIEIKKTGVFIEGEFGRVDGPPSLKEALDKAWTLVKMKYVQGLSIGFNPIEAEPIKGSAFGMRHTVWELLEVSPVAIAANQDSMITTFKTFDDFVRAASGNSARSVVTLDPKPTSPGVSGTRNGKPMIPVKEHITSLELRRGTRQGQLEAIFQKAADEGRTRDAEEIQKCDELTAEMKAIDLDIAAYRDNEKSMIAKATAITPAPNGKDPQAHGLDLRKPEPVQPIQVKSMVPNGILPARMAIAMYKGGNVPEMAAAIAKRMWPDMPEVEMVLRAAVEAGDTTTSGWASQLVPSAQNLMNEFLELLRPASILGKIPNVNNVPFNVSIPIETASGTVAWVGEGAGKPVGALTFTSATLRWAKAAGIVVITEELARFSQPSAETIIRNSMVKTLSRFFDTQFVGTAAEVSNVSPAGILNGISATSTTGTTPAAFNTDLATLLGKFITNSVDPSNIVLLMSATQAMRLGLMRTDLNVKLYPDINMAGGTLEGFPVIVSENVGTKIIALNAPEILIARENGIQVSVSREATLEMESTPAAGESSPVTALGPMKSLWQNNLVGFRVEMYQTWKRGRDSAVEYLNNVAYVPS